jgi:hypothetical protein
MVRGRPKWRSGSAQAGEVRAHGFDRAGTATDNLGHLVRLQRLADDHITN